MDLLKLTKSPKSINFITRLDRGNFYLSSQYLLKFSDLLGGWKLATNGKLNI